MLPPFYDIITCYPDYIPCHFTSCCQPRIFIYEYEHRDEKWVSIVEQRTIKDDIIKDQRLSSSSSSSSLSKERRHLSFNLKGWMRDE